MYLMMKRGSKIGWKVNFGLTLCHSLSLAGFQSTFVNLEAEKIRIQYRYKGVFSQVHHQRICLGLHRKLQSSQFFAAHAC